MSQSCRRKRSLVSGADEDSFVVALVIPLQGPAGLFGPSCELCAQLASEELNAQSGILGRRLLLYPVDGGQRPEEVAAEVEPLVTSGAIDAVVGWHISAVREVLAPRVAHRVPYIYTALYEGGERTPGVFLTGETPSRQVLPAIRWLTRERGVRRWCIVGNDYVWPRRTAVAARRYVAGCASTVVAEAFTQLGAQDFDAVLRRVVEADADAVLMLLVGEDAVQFNRSFANAGLDARCLRFSPLMDENMLLATGAGNTRGLSAAAGYFESLVSEESLAFESRYVRLFGPDAPTLTSLGESCYEGIKLLASLAEAAGSIDVRSICAAADSTSYEGPRGTLHLRDRHVDQRIYLADADSMEFDVVTQL